MRPTCPVAAVRARRRSTSAACHGWPPVACRPCPRLPARRRFRCGCDPPRGRGLARPRCPPCARRAGFGTRRAALSAPAPRPPLRLEGRCHFPSRPTRCGSSVLDDHSLFAVVIPARRANAMGLFHVTAARTGLQRRTHRLVMSATRALLALRGSTLGYGHYDRPL